MADTSTFVDEAKYQTTSYYVSTSAAALFTYDFVLTFGDEVSLFWNRRVTGATALFLLNRYLMLALQLWTGFFNFLPVNHQSCVSSAIADEVLHIAQYVPWAAFAALRAFALSRSLPLSLLVLALTSVPMFVNLVPLWSGLDCIDLPTVGWAIINNVPLSVGKRLTIASRASLLTADAILVFVTWYTLSAQNGVSHPLVGKWKNTLMFVLMRDGTLYFMVLFFLNSCYLVLNLVEDYVPPGFTGTLPVLFTDPMVSILISRFLINLQQTSREEVVDLNSQLEDGGAQQHSTTVTLRSIIFERVMDSLGSSVISTDEEEQEAVDEYQLMENPSVRARREGC